MSGNEWVGIIVVLCAIDVILWIAWKATEARENLKKEIDRVIKEVRKSNNN